jgi:hypothetical protein
MDTLQQPTVSEPLATRIKKVREAMEEVEAWFDGGLPPEPWAA